ncbi:MAG: CHAT domain-containing protein [Caldilineaceae bacterium]
MINILFLASNPEGVVPIKLDEEIRLITQKFRESDYRDVLKLESLWAVRPNDLEQALLVHKPHVVHFSGHGNVQGEIILMDRNRQARPVSAEALRKLFATLKDNIRVVVLNACYSQVQAEAIADVIDCVIGMGEAIEDDAAITFAASFYQAIGFGRSISEAFELGKTELLLEGIPEADAPKLITRPGVDPAAVFLVGRTQVTFDLSTLAELLEKSGRAETSDRRALCDEIGINPNNLPFLSSGSNHAFAVQLVHYLYDIGGSGMLIPLCDKMAKILEGPNADKLATIRDQLR